MSKINLILVVNIISFIVCTSLLTSCLKDAECHFTYHLHVKINGEPGVVDSVSLYVFNADKSFKEIIEVPVDESSNKVLIPLNHLASGEYTFVAWGNLMDGQQRPDPASLRSIEDACISLKNLDNETYNSPDDLYYGRLSTHVDRSSEKEDEVVISRSVGGVVIKAFNLIGFFEKKDTCFRMRMRGSLVDIPFIHDLTSGVNNLPPAEVEPKYEPSCIWKEGYNLYQSELFLVFPSAEETPILIDLYHEETMLGTFKINNLIKANKITEVTLNFWNEKPEQWFNILDWSEVIQEEDL